MRTNGAQWPLNPLQVAAWFFSVFLPVVFYVCIVPFFSEPAQIALYIIHSVLIAASIGLNIILSYVNPADPAVVNALHHQNPNRPKQLEPGKHAIDENNFCVFCQCHVGEKSKHCRLCDKCVSGFDHHCKWLNTCVGRKTYKMFYCYVLSTLLGAMLQFASAICLFISYFVNKSEYVAKAATLYGGYPESAIPALSGILAILALVASALLGHLFAFHCFLICHGMSTYEYIVHERMRKEAETAAAARAGHEPPHGPKPGRFNNKIVPIDVPHASINGEPHRESPRPEQPLSARSAFSGPSEATWGPDELQSMYSADHGLQMGSMDQGPHANMAAGLPDGEYARSARLPPINGGVVVVPGRPRRPSEPLPALH